MNHCRINHNIKTNRQSCYDIVLKLNVSTLLDKKNQGILGTVYVYNSVFLELKKTDGIMYKLLKQFVNIKIGRFPSFWLDQRKTYSLQSIAIKTNVCKSALRPEQQTYQNIKRSTCCCNTFFWLIRCVTIRLLYYKFDGLIQTINSKM